MQRKRRNINFGYFSGSSGKSKFNNSITKLTLHSIPTVRMSESNKKSYARIEPCPICGKEDIYQPTSVVWWRSPHCRSSERRNRTRASHIIMTPHSRLVRYPRSLIHNTRISRYLRPLPYLSIVSLLVLSFLALTPNLYSNDSAYAVEDTNAGVSGRSTSAGLSVSSTKLTETVSPGSTVYVNNTVSVNAKDIESYSLTISGPTTMKNGSTTIEGSGGNTPSSMGDNTWGYAWDSSNNGSGFTDSSATYNSLPGTNTSTKLTTPALSNYGVEFSRKLGFAAKFAEDADPGHYIADITLSLVATPRTLGVWSTGQAAGISTMQQMNTAICNQVPTPAAGATDVPTMTLLDSRDGNYYNIAKYADGRCWMQENLRLQGGRTLTSADSDVTSNFNLPTTLTDETITKTDFSDSDMFAAKSYNTNKANSGNTTYYNWYTATAGIGDSSIATNNQNVNASICPKGWTLPTGGSASDANTESTWSDYYKLFRNMGLTFSNTNLNPGANDITNWGLGDLAVVQDDTYNFKYTGNVVSGSLLAGNSHGFWWSSTAFDADSLAYSLSIHSSGVYPGNYFNSRLYGWTVRCVAREPDLSGITTMQEMTPGVCEKTSLISGQKYSAEYILKDTRDGKSYTVRKFGDGKCWMTSNLKLKLTTTGLSKDDTDLNQGYDWDQTTRSGVAKPTDTLTSISAGDGTFTGARYKVESYITSSSNAGETGYYSWNAATAGTGGTNSSDAIAANSQAPSSICPKGWKLPTGGTTGNTEFYNLFNTIKNSSGVSIYENDTLKTSDYTNWKSPAADNLAVAQNATDSSSKVIYNFKYTGYVYNGSLGGDSDIAYWWSSTANGVDSAYDLYIRSSYVRPGTDYSYRYVGIAVRCIARS